MMAVRSVFRVLSLLCIFSLSVTEKLAFPTVVLICFDGYRWDYLQRGSLVNFKKFIENGVKADSMRSSFVTRSFPNLVTLVTGLHPESHGIIANKMYDPNFNDTFSFDTVDSKWYEDFEPIWITNEKEVVTKMSAQRRSAVIQWGAANVKFDRKLPWYHKGRNASSQTQDVFGKIISFLDIEKPPNLIVAYLEEIGRVGRNYGPASSQMRNALLSVDKQFGIFLNQLESKQLHNEVNIVVVSDHGMAEVTKEQTIYMSDILNPILYYYADIGTASLIWPKKTYQKSVSGALFLSDHIYTYKKADIPERFHYKRHRRVPPLLVIAHEGWTIAENPTSKHYAGSHGYDNHWEKMNGIFIARGPAFKKGITTSSFSNIHVYPLLCHILGIKPRPNNGSLGVLKHVLSGSPRMGFSVLMLWGLMVSLICTVMK